MARAERRAIWEPVIKTYALQYNADIPSMLYVANCESGFNPNAWNKSDPNGGSKGIFQYQTATFYNNIRSVLPASASADIWNAEQQIELTAFLFSKGKMTLWSCWYKYIGQPVPWQKSTV